jgi:exopolysaccharide/PEP-CTERM locus tyrosine autokinase
MRKSDWEALLSYERKTNRLDLNSPEVIQDPQTVPRLLANKMILPDGSLTVAGRKRSAEYRLQYNRRRPDTIDKPIKADRDPEKPEDSAPPPRLVESDLTALQKYDRETGNILKYDPETGQLDKLSKRVLREPETIQRLIDNGLILPGGWLTSKGLQVCEKRELWAKKESKDKPDSGTPVQKRPETEPAPIPEKTYKESNKAQPEEIKPIELSDEVKKQKVKAAPAEPQPDSTVIDTEKKKTAAVVLKDRLTTPVSDEPGTAVHAEPEKKTISVITASATYKPEAIDKNLVSLFDPQSYEAEQFKILRTNLLYPVSGKIPRSIAITGTVPGEGKSFVAANLAISIANEIDRYVLLIDCDLRRPTIHNLFGYGDVSGLSDYLSISAPLESLLLSTKVDKLSILPAGPLPNNPSELLSSERMSDMLKEVSERYNDRLIILDTPPPSMTAETSALARFVDGILMVVKYGSTTREDVEDLIRTMGRDKIIGSVLNNVDMRSSRYHRYRQYRGQYYSAVTPAGKSYDSPEDAIRLIGTPQVHPAAGQSKIDSIRFATRKSVK